MKLRIAVLGVAFLSVGFADTLTLQNGKTVEGTYLGGDSRSVRMAVGTSVDSFDVRDVANLRFGDAPVAAQTTTQPTRRAVATSQTAARKTGEVPAGAVLVVRMIDDVDSEVHDPGETFRASVDEDLVLDGSIVIPRGADVLTRLVEDKESGKLSGRAELSMNLVSVVVDGRAHELFTQQVTTASESRTGQTAKVVGGTAALGAIIGAIAGGGKGAAIGGLSGAGAGTAIQVLTNGQRVRIPSETRLEFTLSEPLQL